METIEEPLNVCRYRLPKNHWYLLEPTENDQMEQTVPYSYCGHEENLWPRKLQFQIYLPSPTLKTRPFLQVMQQTNIQDHQIHGNNINAHICSYSAQTLWTWNNKAIERVQEIGKQIISIICDLNKTNLICFSEYQLP